MHTQTVRQLAREVDMNRIKHIAPLVTMAVTSALPSHAADGPPDDLIGIVFWIFVAYCALIIVPHGIRALIATFRASRKSEETSAEAADNVTE